MLALLILVSKQAFIGGKANLCSIRRTETTDLESSIYIDRVRYKGVVKAQLWTKSSLVPNL